MLIVRTPQNPTTEKCLPSRTLSIGGVWATSNRSEIHIIFLRAHTNNNTSHADSAHPPKSNYENVPALEIIFDWGHLPYF
jgi:hypothetical protein